MNGICKLRQEALNQTYPAPESHLSQEQSIFLRVLCKFHPNEQASRYIPFSFTPICKLCFIPSELNVKLLIYKDIEREFFCLLQKFQEKIDSDRIRRLISEDFQELLESCRWLCALFYGPSCFNHPWTEGFFIDSGLEVFCEECFNRTEQKNEFKDLRNIEKTGVFLMDFIKTKVKTEKNLNRFMIEKGAIRRQEIPKDKDTLILYLMETKDFFAAGSEKLKKKRCVACSRTTSVGNKLPVELQCGHTMCFSCINSEYAENCPIDYKKIIYNNCEMHQFSPGYECHQNHLISEEKIITRLPCFHYSCKIHESSEFCEKCGFFLINFPKSFKNSKKIENFLNFTSFVCPRHSLKVTKVQLFPLELQCNSCISNEKVSFEISENKKFDNFLMQKIYYHALCPEQWQNLSIFSNLYQENLLKLAVCLGIVSMKSRQLFLALVRSFQGNHQVDSNVFLKFFNKLYPSLSDSSRELILEEMTEFYIHLVPRNDLILTSLIIADQFIALPVFNLPVVLDEVEVKAVKKEDGTVLSVVRLLAYCEVSELNSDNSKLLKNSRVYILSKSLYMTDKNRYEITVKVNKGRYFHGVPFSRNKEKYFSEIKFGKIRQTSKKLSFAGPIVGLGLFDLSMLVGD